MTANTKDLASLSPTGGTSTDGTIDMWITTGSTSTMRKMIINGTSSGTPYRRDN